MTWPTRRVIKISLVTYGDGKVSGDEQCWIDADSRNYPITDRICRQSSTGETVIGVKRQPVVQQARELCQATLRIDLPQSRTGIQKIDLAEPIDGNAGPGMRRDRR